ncbi:hypothetical protein L581_0917 [Serratia fonticola AU-AP2C]|nr:hypothetical protein L581_0917 [Serratia fonticola AU-AP2C]
MNLGKKKSQHPSWLSKHWKQCEQCRAFSKQYQRLILSLNA